MMFLPYAQMLLRKDRCFNWALPALQGVSCFAAGRAEMIRTGVVPLSVAATAHRCLWKALKERCRSLDVVAIVPSRTEPDPCSDDPPETGPWHPARSNPVDAASREITRIEQAILQGDDRLLEEQYGDLQAGLKRAPQGTGMEMLTTQVSKRRGTSWFSGPEPAYPLGPRFADPRQGPAGGCAPFDPPRRNPGSRDGVFPTTAGGLRRRRSSRSCSRT